MVKKRLLLVMYAIFGLYFVLALRLVYIHAFPASSQALKEIADHQYLSQIEAAPYRGEIFDRRNVALAVSLKRPSLAINPRVFDPSASQLQALSKLLSLKPSTLRKIAAKKTYFAWIKRRLEPSTAEQIKSLEINGLHFINEAARYYPGGQLAANLIGSVGTDNTGLFGLEAQYEDLLKGSADQVLTLRDAKGKRIFLNAKGVNPEKTGHNIYLTLDRAIQEIAEEALQNGVHEASARSGFAVVMDPHTGRIFAMANSPSFNPNQIAKVKIDDTKNFAISTLFEPGSILKPLVVASAIDSGITTRDEMHNCEISGAYEVAAHSVIHDDHPKASLSTADVLVHSSNICIFKIAKRMGEQGLSDSLRDFGLGSEDNDLGLPGQSFGRISDWRDWKPIRFANISFGQGILWSGIELMTAYAAIANGGMRIRPYLVERIESQNGSVLASHHSEQLGRVISAKTAKIMHEILAKVVREGTGKTASTAAYTVAGKTGTAEKIDPLTKGYSDDKRIADFIGFAPAFDPHLLILVVIDEPGKKPYYGGKWAAPVFSQIAARALAYLNVAQDRSS